MSTEYSNIKQVYAENMAIDNCDASLNTYLVRRCLSTVRILVGTGAAVRSNYFCGKQWIDSESYVLCLVVGM